MPINTDTLNTVVDLVNQIATEIVHAQAESDAGLIPSFCMVGELAEVADSSPFLEAAKMVHQTVDQRLDVETTWDAPTLQQVQDFINWAQIAISQVNSGAEPFPFESSVAPEPNSEEVSPSATPSVEDANELKKLADEVDILLELIQKKTWNSSRNFKAKPSIISSRLRSPCLR
ncbi:MAG: hypothetical protein HRU10_10935 [Opitutales bacterium]|nr:hypothetical protein [Opitutales bacterium]